jgi:hypothetical protein
LKQKELELEAGAH